MYGVVLMMALSGGADLPAMSDVSAEPVARYGDNGHKEYRCGGRRGGRCHGGGGCYGGGCYGGGYGGCYGGGGYGGCCGGGYRYGGYYGSSGYGGGYYGAMPYGMGSSPYGSTTYYGYAPINNSMNYGNLPSDYTYGTPLDQGARYGERGLGANAEAPATITVRLPADARLTVDGAKTQATESSRTFVSPPLQPGKEYQYTLRCEVTRDGKKVERTKDITVRAGQQSEVTFDLPAEDGSSNK
jgi:uncharacterized protein (TIGR03000 family)